MHCRSCVLLIQETLARESCVHEVIVDLDSGLGHGDLCLRDATGDTMCAIVTWPGYPAAPLAPDHPDS
jgi:hypothetical protein